MACGVSSGSAACYLCNRSPETRRLRPSEAVPLLRVQKSSVIVTVRRRGASRGRPVLGGSLKSHLRNEDALIINVFSREVLTALYGALYKQQLGGLHEHDQEPYPRLHGGSCRNGRGT